MTQMIRLAFISLLLTSCGTRYSENFLPGKICVGKPMSNEYSIYDNSAAPYLSARLGENDSIEYQGITWLNKKDGFIGSEAFLRQDTSEYRSNLVEFSLAGKLVDRIYTAKPGEIAWPLYSSRDDKYLLFTTHQTLDPKLHPFEGLAPTLSLVIMELDKKRIIAKIDGFGRLPDMIEESPWLADGCRFVYTASSNYQLVREGKIISPFDKNSEFNIYVYDVGTGENNLLVPKARGAIASPIKNEIFYEKQNSIRLFNLETKKERIIHEYDSRKIIRNLHYTPDGKYIYFAYTYNWFGEFLAGIFFHDGEALVEIKTGRVQYLKSSVLSSGYFTWK